MWIKRAEKRAQQRAERERMAMVEGGEIKWRKPLITKRGVARLVAAASLFFSLFFACPAALGWNAWFDGDVPGTLSYTVTSTVGFLILMGIFIVARRAELAREELE
jgi:hypothetical protein